MRITPLALSVFRRMETLPDCECADVDADGRRPGGECPSCQQWWSLHSHLHDLLHLPPHAFPAYEAEGDEGERERYATLQRALDEHDAKSNRKAAGGAGGAQDGAAEAGATDEADKSEQAVGEARTGAGALRMRELRRRERLGHVLCTAEIHEARVIEALLRSERLTESAALDPAAVAAELGAVIDDWARRWLEKV